MYNSCVFQDDNYIGISFDVWAKDNLLPGSITRGFGVGQPGSNNAYHNDNKFSQHQSCHNPTTMYHQQKLQAKLSIEWDHGRKWVVV